MTEGFFFQAFIYLTAAVISVPIAKRIGLGSVLRSSSFLFDVSTYDLLSMLGAPLILGAVASLATYVPARRAARVDPVQALRSE